MKQIFKIYFNDLKAIRQSLVATVVIVGLIVMPGIYAWLNIDSNWDPYEYTGNLPIAIINKDKGTTILGDELNVGESLVNNLKENKDMNWVDYHKDREREVDRELRKSTTLYGEIIIPEDFSKNFTTVFESKKLEKPNLKFIANHKRNAVAPMLVKKAVGAIENTLNKNFVESIILKALNTADELGLVTKIAKTTDDLIDKLDKTKDNIDSLRAVFKALQLASDSTSSTLSALRDLLPTVDSLAKTTGKGADNLQKALKSFKNLSNNVDNVIDEMEKEAKEVNDIIKSIDLEPQRENGEIVSKKMDEVSEKLLEKANKIKVLKNFIHDRLADFETPILDKFEGRIQKLIDDIEGARKIIENNKKTKGDIKDIRKQLNQVALEDISVNKQYREDIRSNLGGAYGNASNSLDDVQNLMSGINNTLAKSDKALEKLIHALDNSKDLNDNMDVVFTKIQEEIDKAIETLEGKKEKELYNNIVNILENDPDKVADFLSNPVHTETENLYYVKNYGSKMAPFYTVLACWVGATVLIAIVKSDLEQIPESEKYKNYQKFLGRFMLFGSISMCQGFVIALGDIILRVEIKSIPLFILTVVLSSLVFMLFIYSMGVSFGKVGLAITIVIMVLQVAGSGGTFPIELLPRAFRVLQPVMPFYPAISALRETIGGLFEYDYYKYMLMLLAHIIIPLILGLVLRNPLIHLKEKIEKELEKTNMII